MKDELIQKQVEYIALLEKECARLMNFVIIRPYFASVNKDDVEMGKKLREEIKELSCQIEKTK